jgi:glycerol kinase
MSSSTPLHTASLDSGSSSSSSPSNQQIFDLLVSMQKNTAKLEARLDDIEKLKGSPGFEVLSSHDWQPSANDGTSEFIGAIDQGTTSSRFLIFSTSGEPVASHQIEFKQIYPNSGYVRTS